MKKLLSISLISIIICSCTGKPNPTTETEKNVPNELHQELYGFWVGDFLYEGSEDQMMDDEFTDKLNINIKRITKDSVFAQSILRGEVKSLTGALKEQDGKIIFILKQPKGNKENGIFECQLKKDTLIGKWKAYKPEDADTFMSYKLLKKKPVYDAKLMLPNDGANVDWITSKEKIVSDTTDGTVSGYKLPYFRSATNQIYKLNASSKILKETDLKNLSKLDLEIIRNTIFARHGYIFKKERFRQFFDPVPWYVPTNVKVDQQLTTIEKSNISLLARFEKYAEDNYDTFGR